MAVKAQLNSRAMVIVLELRKMAVLVLVFIAGQKVNFK